MNCFYDMVDQRKVFSIISSQDHCQRSSPSRIFNTPRAGFEPGQNLSSGLVEWSCAVVITTTPRRHKKMYLATFWFKGALSGLRQFLATESPLKMMKNAFISPWKLFPFSRYLSFCLDFLVMYQNGLIKKITLIWNFIWNWPNFIV